jgi:lysylphosphatidylglycerol synthetase-like protein (DUF2156 family)
MKFLRSAVEMLCWLWLLATTPPDHPEQPDPVMNKKLKSLLDVSWLRWLWSVKSLLILIAVVVVAFFALPRLLHSVDDTSASLDAGVLSFAAFALVCVMVLGLAFWAFVKSELPVVDKWIDEDLEGEAEPVHRVSFRKDWLEMAPQYRVFAFVALIIGFMLAGAHLVAGVF